MPLNNDTFITKIMKYETHFTAREEYMQHYTVGEGCGDQGRKIVFHKFSFHIPINLQNSQSC